MDILDILKNFKISGTINEEWDFEMPFVLVRKIPIPPPTLVVTAPAAKNADSPNGSPVAVTWPLHNISGGATITGGREPYNVTYSPARGSNFAVGTTSVLITVTSADGQVDTDSFNVIVTDQSPAPAPPNLVLNQPADQIRTSIDGNPVGVTWGFTASGGVQPYTFGVTVGGVSKNSGDLFAVGTYTATVTVTDSQGTPDTDQKTFSIQVINGANSSITANTHPRFFLTPTKVAEVRGWLDTDAEYRTEVFQKAVTDFESPGGYFAAGGNNGLTLFGAALLLCLRKPNDDQGVTWTYSRQHYIDRINNGIHLLDHSTNHSPTALAHSLIWDTAYEFFTAENRAAIEGWLANMRTNPGGLGYMSSHSHWDDQGSTKHLARLLLDMGRSDYQNYSAVALQEVINHAEAHEKMIYGEGIGYYHKNAYAASGAPVFGAYLLKNCLGLTKEETVDKCITALRDAPINIRQLAIPSPSYTHASDWRVAKLNFQTPWNNSYQRTATVGVLQMWAHYVLPGKVNISPGNDHTHQSLANSEDDLLGCMTYYSDVMAPGNSADRGLHRIVTNMKWIQTGSPTTDRGHIQVLFGIAPWLLEKVTIRPAKTPVQAGIPRDRRWFPDTMNLVTSIGGEWESATDQSLFLYYHRPYYNNSYTEGLRQNGMWQYHRGGPLYVRRMSTSHCPSSKRTFFANACIFFEDVPTYTEFVRQNPDWNDAGGCRDGISLKTWQAIVAEPKNEFGKITAFQSSDNALSITSDLTRSYNSTVVSLAGDGPIRLSHYTKEIILVKRGIDGSQHEKIFELIRLEVLGNGDHIPWYNLQPSVEPDIDGVITPFTPWYPGDGGVSLGEPKEAIWRASGPIRWDVTGASRIIIDNSTLPRAPYWKVNANGNGKAVTTYLEPSGAELVLRKRGGLNHYWYPGLTNDGKQTGTPGAQYAKYDNCPFQDFYGGQLGNDGEWETTNGYGDRLGAMGYTGIWTVSAARPRDAFAATQYFLTVTEGMLSIDSHTVPTGITTDANSKGAKCGGTIVSFKKTSGIRNIGSILVPPGTTFISIVNLTPNAIRTLSPAAGLTITSANRTAGHGGRLDFFVTVSGGSSVNLNFS